MKHERNAIRAPYGRGDYSLQHGGLGIYWQAGHGMEIRLAAAEEGPETRSGDRPGESSPLEVWRGAIAG